MFSTVGQPVRLAASCPARLRDINSLRAAGLLKKRVCLERRRQRDASAALVLAASLGPGDDSFFSSRDLIADAMLRDIRAFERRMDQLFSEPSTSLEPSWRRDRESSRTIDEGGVKGYSYYKESIIVYGGTPAPPFQAVQQQPSVPLGLFFLLGVWGAVASRLFQRFRLTSYKESFRVVLSLLWPIALVNQGFRENLAKTLFADDSSVRRGGGGAARDRADKKDVE